ncbi:hypothetical protein F8M41_019118 [Gigaspora margarita]|uniref:F-box domain-containing protein n=1 Tax=Gigaspora margarita TaxID=4874 RepID=A0A8H3WWB2_GIGMA|nr:hypothetical protein F8M41_019118 [Gigaspora margarita]
MASKIFTGNMPELMENILNNLDNEISSLYQCTLVSRHWCKMSILILWQDPFSFDLIKGHLLIPKYISSFGEYEKSILEKDGINADFSKTLFDYARFLKVLDLYNIANKINEWIFYLEDVKQYNETKNHIISLLFKLFIESGATLHEFVFTKYLNFEPKTLSLLKQNDQFFSRLQHLSLSDITHFSLPVTIDFFMDLLKIPTKISALELDLSYDNDSDDDCRWNFIDVLIYIIKSQERLRLFSLRGDKSSEFHGIISALENQKNSLQEVIVKNCHYSAEFEVLKNCKNLETLRIRNCSKELLKTLNYKVNTLEIVDSSIDASTIVPILEKSGLLLQRLRLKIESSIREESLLLKTLNTFCPNVTYLNIINIEFSAQFLELIGNLQKLQFLTLQCTVGDVPKEELKIQAMQFAEILPLTLQYLNLRHNTWLESYNDIFLNHCNAPLKRLFIDRFNNEKIVKALIEFCIRNKALKYVAVYKLYDLYDLEDNTRKEVETYVSFVPFKHIIVKC